MKTPDFGPAFVWKLCVGCALLLLPAHANATVVIPDAVYGVTLDQGNFNAGEGSFTFNGMMGSATGGPGIPEASASGSSLLSTANAVLVDSATVLGPSAASVPLFMQYSLGATATGPDAFESTASADIRVSSGSDVVAAGSVTASNFRCPLCPKRPPAHLH